MRPLESHDAILRITRRLLDKADAWDRFPTPVDDIVNAAGLIEPQESLLSESVLGRAPKHLARLFRKYSGRIRGVLDRRALEIHLDPQVSYEPRRRFIRLHESAHHVLPWQSDVDGYADDDAQLAPHVRSTFERESNQGAAELLFQQTRFAEDAAWLEIGLGAVAYLAEKYGASLRASLRRYAEHHSGMLTAGVLDPKPVTLEGLAYRRRELTASEKFSKQFGNQDWPKVVRIDDYPFLAEAGAAAAQVRTIVKGEWRISDLRGEETSLRLEVMHTGHNILVLAWCPQRTWLKRKVKLAG